jgi:hypothetical protein
MKSATDFLRRMQEAARETLVIEDGTISNISHTFGAFGRVKNWIAVVEKDYSAPGGLRREFFKRGPLDRFFVPAEMNPGQWLEFGGDRVSGSGKRKHKRAYREVVAAHGNELVLKPIAVTEVGRGATSDVNPPDSESASEAGASASSPEGTGLSFVSTDTLVAELTNRGYLVTKEK